MYALSYAYYRKEDFKNAYFWLMQYIEVNIDAKNMRQEKLLWERCLLDYLCGNINLALKELNLLVRTNVERSFFEINKIARILKMQNVFF